MMDVFSNAVTQVYEHQA